MTMTAAGTATPAAARRLTGQRDFRMLWTGYAVSSLGSEVTVLALPLAAAVMLHASPLQMGLLTAAGTAPVLAFGLLAGVWVDRLPRRRPLLVAADLLAAAVLATVPVAYLLGVLTVTQLIAVELAVGSCRVLFRPAYSSHLTDVVRREELTQASGHLRTAESGAALLGPGLGGLLIQLVTAPLAVAIDAASFVASAVCLRRLRSPERERASSERPRHLRRELAEGLNAVLGDPSLRAIAGAAANLNLFGMLVMALFVVYATRSLGFTAGMVGAIVTLGGIGALSGAVLAPRVAARIGAGRTIVLATVVFSFGLFVFPLAAGPRWVELLVLCGGELVMGVAVMFFDVTASGVTLSRVPPELLGRVSACSGFITQGVKPIGALAGGVLGTTLGLREALWVAALGATTTMLWTVFSPLRWDAGGAQGRCQSGSGGPIDALSEELA